jgi:hypothetical protein
MIVPLIATTIAETPMVSNKVLRNILKPYGKAYCFKEKILQNSRTKARKLIFRVPEENVGYASFLKDKLEKLCHFVLLFFTNQKETIKNLKKIIIADEVLHQKDAHLKDLAPNNRRAFVLNRMNENSKILLQQLGWNSDNVSFFDGVMFAPLFVQKTIPHFQKTYMADACHLNFGKYMLHSCYGVNANSNMSPVGFAIIFGNENTSNWTKFWEYVLKLHPSMNSGCITIITDQDEGKKNTIARQLQQVGHFHCSWHCHQNIIKRYGGGSGKTQYSALWMYHKLMRCCNPGKIEYTRTMFVKHIAAKDLRYLNSINDEEQYPGARCAMADKGIYMYQRPASSAVELMNAANKEMQARTAVDALNATLLLIRLECNRFQRMKQEAGGDDLGLTPRGKDEYDSTYTDLFSHHYSYNVTDVETHWQVRVQHNNVERAEPQYVQFPKEAVNGSFFGTCCWGYIIGTSVPIPSYKFLRRSVTPNFV